MLSTEQKVDKLHGAVLALASAMISLRGAIISLIGLNEVEPVRADLMQALKSSGEQIDELIKIVKELGADS